MDTPNLPTKDELSEALNIARWEYISVEGVLLNLGLLLGKHGHREAATTIWNVILQCNPKFGPAWYNLSALLKLDAKHCLKESLAWERASVHGEKHDDPDFSEEELQKNCEHLLAGWKKELDVFP